MSNWSLILKKEEEEELRQEEQDRLELLMEVLEGKYDALDKFDDEIEELEEKLEFKSERRRSKTDTKSQGYALQSKIRDFQQDLKEAKEAIQNFDKDIKENDKKLEEELKKPLDAMEINRAKELHNDRKKTIVSVKEDSEKAVEELPQKIKDLQEEYSKIATVGSSLDTQIKNLRKKIKEKTDERNEYLRENPEGDAYAKFRGYDKKKLGKEINRIKTVLGKDDLIIEEASVEAEEEEEEIEEFVSFHKPLLTSLNIIYNQINTVLNDYVKDTLLKNKDSPTEGVYRNSAGKLEIADYESLLDINKKSLVNITNALSVEGVEKRLYQLININDYHRNSPRKIDISRNTMSIPISSEDAEQIMEDSTWGNLHSFMSVEGDTLKLDLSSYLSNLIEMDKIKIPVDGDNVFVQEVLAQYLYIISGGKLNINKKRDDIKYRDNMKGLLQSFRIGSKGITNVDLKKLLETSFQVEKDSIRLSNNSRQEVAELKELLESEKTKEFFQGDKFRKYSEVLLKDLRDGMDKYFSSWAESSEGITANKVESNNEAKIVNAFMSIVNFNFGVKNEKLMEEVNKLNTQYVKNSKSLTNALEKEQKLLSMQLSKISSYQLTGKLGKSKIFSNLEEIQNDLKELSKTKESTGKKRQKIQSKIKQFSKNILEMANLFKKKEKFTNKNGTEMIRVPYLGIKEDRENDDDYLYERKYLVLTIKQYEARIKAFNKMRSDFKKYLDKVEEDGNTSLAREAKLLTMSSKIKGEFRKEVMATVDKMISEIIEELQKNEEGETSDWDMITGELDNILIARTEGRKTLNLGLYGAEDNSTLGVFLKNLVDENKKFKREYLNITKETRSREIDGKIITQIYDSKSAEDVANEMTASPEKFKEGVELFAERVKGMQDIYDSSSKIIETVAIIRQEFNARIKRIQQVIERNKDSEEEIVQNQLEAFRDKIKRLESLSEDAVDSKTDRILGRSTKEQYSLDSWTTLRETINLAEDKDLSNALSTLDREFDKIEKLLPKMKNSLSIRTIQRAMPTLLRSR